MSGTGTDDGFEACTPPAIPPPGLFPGSEVVVGVVVVVFVVFVLRVVVLWEPPPLVVVVPPPEAPPADPPPPAATGVVGVILVPFLRSAAIVAWSARRMSSCALEYVETSDGRCRRASR